MTMNQQTEFSNDILNDKLDVIRHKTLVSDNTTCCVKFDCSKCNWKI